MTNLTPEEGKAVESLTRHGEAGKRSMTPYCPLCTPTRHEAGILAAAVKRLDEEVEALKAELNRAIFERDKAKYDRNISQAERDELKAKLAANERRRAELTADVERWIGESHFANEMKQRAEEDREKAEARVKELEAKLAAMREGWIKLVLYWGHVEARSAEAHAVYQEEAHRRGDVRHPDAYADLSESTKEWDRVLVRWVQRKLEEWHTFDNEDKEPTSARRTPSAEEAAKDAVIEAAYRWDRSDPEERDEEPLMKALDSLRALKPSLDVKAKADGREGR